MAALFGRGILYLTAEHVGSMFESSLRFASRVHSGHAPLLENRLGSSGRITRYRGLEHEICGSTPWDNRLKNASTAPRCSHQSILAPLMPGNVTSRVPDAAI